MDLESKSEILPFSAAKEKLPEVEISGQNLAASINSGGAEIRVTTMNKITFLF